MPSHGGEMEIIMKDEVFVKQITDDKFDYRHSKTYENTNDTFYLHNHNDMFETLIFVSGKADFTVEGSTYSMKSGNILMVSPNEMHRMRVDFSHAYERIVLMTHKSFYDSMPQLGQIFAQRKPGENNVIDISDADRKIIFDICKKIEYYNDSFPDNDIKKEVTKNLVTELIYVIACSKHIRVETAQEDERMKKILSYINENLCEKLTLEIIANKFFINKYHLCRIFKVSTGMTVKKYVNYKRLLLANDLHASGKNLTEACFSSGFENYSTFYKLYKDFTGDCPRRGGNIIMQKPHKDLK